MIYSKYSKRLLSKINKIKLKNKLTNDDLHRLFHYYDMLDYYLYYDNESEYKAKEKLWREELNNEEMMVA